ncbi:MAG: hypothetical protein AB7M12_00600 [Hyphomonadaceae bacterium]
MTLPIEGPGSNTGHGYVWERPDGVRARCGGTAICVACATDHARWSQALAKNAPIPGLMTTADAPATEFVDASPELQRAFDLVVKALIQDMARREGSPFGHKAHVLHSALMQTQNAVFRVVGRMTIGAYVDGIANYVAQALAIGPPERLQAQYDEFQEVLPAIFANARTAGWGAGVSFDDVKGRS